MKKSIHRIVAFVLVPCLIADPSLAASSTFQALPAFRHLSAVGIRFNAQALASVGLAAQATRLARPNQKRPYSFASVGASALLEHSAAAGGLVAKIRSWFPSKSAGKWSILGATPLMVGFGKGSAVLIGAAGIVAAILVARLVQLRRRRNAEIEEALMRALDTPGTRDALRSGVGDDYLQHLTGEKPREAGMTFQKLRDTKKNHVGKTLNENDVKTILETCLTNIETVFGDDPVVGPDVRQDADVMRVFLSILPAAVILHFFRDFEWLASYLEVILMFRSMPTAETLSRLSALPFFKITDTLSGLLERFVLVVEGARVPGTAIPVIDATSVPMSPGTPAQAAFIGSLLDEIKEGAPDHYPLIVKNSVVFRILPPDAKRIGGTMPHVRRGVIDVNIAAPEPLVMMTLVEEADHTEIYGQYEETDLQRNPHYVLSKELQSYGQIHTPYVYLLELHAVLTVRRFALKMLHRTMSPSKRTLWIEALAEDAARAADISRSLERAGPEFILTERGLALFQELRSEIAQSPVAQREETRAVEIPASHWLVRTLSFTLSIPHREVLEGLARHHITADATGVPLKGLLHAIREEWGGLLKGAVLHADAKGPYEIMLMFFAEGKGLTFTQDELFHWSTEGPERLRMKAADPDALDTLSDAIDRLTLSDKLTTERPGIKMNSHWLAGIAIAAVMAAGWRPHGLAMPSGVDEILKGAGLPLLAGLALGSAWKITAFLFPGPQSEAYPAHASLFLSPLRRNDFAGMMKEVIRERLLRHAA